MLDFLSPAKSTPLCALCEGAITNENCSPKGCTHVFHPSCFESWTASKLPADELACPVADCSLKFSEIVIRKIPHGSATKVVSLKDSHQCPICCEPIQTPVATPESCNHAFCYTCIREWCRIRHECPLDRGAFELLLLSDKVGGPITQRISAPPVEVQEAEEVFAEIDTNCEVCASADDEAHLLLCDNCDRGYHTYCLPVPLLDIPPGDWFCPVCVRNGIGSNTGDGVNTQRPRHRVHVRDTQLDSSSEIYSSEDEDFYPPVRLSHTAQRVLELRASRRHRGSRLLRDTILNLAQRALSEVSARARQRRTQRQRVRDQLASETIDNRESSGRSLDPSQRLLRLEASSEPNRPPQLRLSRAGPALPAATDTTTERDARLQNVRTQAHRRRLLVLSDSGSDSSDDIGTSNSRSTRRRLASDSDSEELTRISEPKRSRRESNTNESFNFGDSTTAEPGVSSGAPQPSTSRVQPQHSSEYESNYPDNGRKTISRRKRKQRKTPSRKDSITRKRRSLSKKGSSHKGLLKRRKKLSAVQRRLKKRVTQHTSATSSTSKSASNHSSPTKRLSIRAVPRLSLFGAEPISGVFDESPPISTAEISRPQPSSSSTFRSVNGNLLSEIEAKQASTFKFTTRHMQVNADHSICPIPVSQTTSTSVSNPIVSRNNSLPGKQKYPFTERNSSVRNEYSSTAMVVQPTTQRPRDSHPVDTGRQQVGHFNGLVPNHTTAQAVPSSAGVSFSSASSQNGWNSEKINHIRKLVKANLKPRLTSGLIDKATYKRIRERTLFKVQQKHASKVTDNRVVKLVNEYVDYCLRHVSSDSSNRSGHS